MAEETIKAKMPGIFYDRPDPDSNPYVQVGSKVANGDTVGLVEVMKSFHIVTAEQPGTVSKLLVGNEEAVSPGQDLVLIDTE